MTHYERVILDLCAGSGAWSNPYLEAGYDVRRVDLPKDVRLLPYPGTVWGILAAPPEIVNIYVVDGAWSPVPGYREREMRRHPSQRQP